MEYDIFIKNIIMKGVKMNLHYFFPNRKEFDELFEYDKKLRAAFENKINLNPNEIKEPEMKIVKLLRLCQANEQNLWGKYYRRKMGNYAKKTGMGLSCNLKIGKGLIIGHSGRIVINGGATFGDNIVLTHGVTIGRDIRGKRKGAPQIGNQVCIRTNSTVTGNITIGDDVLIAPNTFVNFDVPSHSIVIGNPASIHHRDNATEGHIGYEKI